MGNPPIKLTRTLLTFKTMTLKLHVKMEDKSENFSFHYHNETEFMGSKYLRLAPSTFLTIDIVDKENNIGFDKSRSVLITQNNIFHLIMVFRRILKKIYQKDLFLMKGRELILEQDVAKEAEEMLQLNTNNAIICRPAIVYDENETSYEGVHLFLNKMSNVIPLTFTELETLLYTLEKIDLFQYSQLLLNYYVSYYKDKTENHPQKKRFNPRNIFGSDSQESTVSSNFAKEEDDIMSGLIK